MLQKCDIATSGIRVLVPKLVDAHELLPYLEQIDENRIYSNYGPLSKQFSVAIAQLTSASGVTLTCNGTSAIELALRAIVEKPGGLCMMPAFTFIASAHAVCNAGLTPFFIEVDPSTLMLTPAIAEAALHSSPHPPSAILVVSAFGAPPDFAAWAEFEEKHGIPVVFDAAAAVTSLSGHIGMQPVCISLHATKVLGIGEGGAILSCDQELIERTTAMTGFGFVGPDRVSALRGGNYRVSEYAAAVGLASLDALPTKLEKLRNLIYAYRDRLAKKSAVLQAGVGETWVTMTLNVILPEFEVAPTLRRFAAERIEWRRWWGFGCHRHPAFETAPRTNLSITDALAPRVIGIPFHDRLSKTDLDLVTACLP